MFSTLDNPANAIQRGKELMEKTTLKQNIGYISTNFVCVGVEIIKKLETRNLLLLEIRSVAKEDIKKLTTTKN